MDTISGMLPAAVVFLPPEKERICSSYNRRNSFLLKQKGLGRSHKELAL